MSGQTGGFGRGAKMPPRSEWKYLRNRTRVIASVQCDDCSYARTIDSQKHPGVSPTHVQEAARVHAKKYRHNMTYSVTNIKRWYGREWDV